MAKDFRTLQIRTNKMIASGSTGTGGQLLVYGIDGASDNEGGLGFGTSGIGQDVFMYVSGGIAITDSSYSGVFVAGGDVFISGNLTVAGTTYPEPPLPPDTPVIQNTRLHLGSYAAVTQSTPQVVGGGFYLADEHFDYEARLRVVLSTGNSSNTAVIRLFNITDGEFVELVGSDIEMTTTSPTPEVVESDDIRYALWFNSNSVFELQLHISGSASPQIAVQHSAELIFFPAS